MGKTLRDRRQADRLLRSPIGQWGSRPPLALGLVLLLAGLGACASDGRPMPSETAVLSPTSPSEPQPAVGGGPGSKAPPHLVSAPEVRSGPRATELNARLLQAFAARPQPIEYTLAPGDLIEITVLDVPELQRVALRIPLQGVVSLPLLGQIRAAGLTGIQLEQDLRARLDRYLQDPQVSVFIRERTSWRVSVIGAVRKPQVHLIDGPRTVLDLLAMSEGISDEAEPVAYLMRSSAPARAAGSAAGPQAEGAAGEGRPGGVLPDNRVAIRLEELLNNPEGEANLPVQPGDVIYVPKAKASDIFVGGAVRGSGRYPLRPNMTVDQAIITAGGVNEMADASDVKIYRETGGPERTIIPVDLNVIQDGQTGPLIQSNDVIVVGQSGMKVFLYGLLGVVRTTVGIGGASFGVGR